MIADIEKASPNVLDSEYKAYIYDSTGAPMFESVFFSASDYHAIYLVRCAMPIRATAELWSESRRLGYLEGPLAPLEILDRHSASRFEKAIAAAICATGHCQSGPEHPARAELRSTA